MKTYVAALTNSFLNAALMLLSSGWESICAVVVAIFAVAMFVKILPFMFKKKLLICWYANFQMYRQSPSFVNPSFLNPSSLLAAVHQLICSLLLGKEPNMGSTSKLAFIETCDFLHVIAPQTVLRNLFAGIIRKYLHRTPSDWQSLIRAQMKSGLSEPVFCQEREISYSNLMSWKKKLAQTRTHRLHLPLLLRLRHRIVSQYY